MPIIEVETPGGIWPVDPTPCNDFDDANDDVKEYATTLAALWLYRLTGRRFGTKDLSIRPCREDCVEFRSTYRGLSATHLGDSGLITTLTTTPFGLPSFGCTSCFCGDPAMLILPVTPANSVTSITIDGVTIADPKAEGFQLFDHRTLVGPPGFAFPTCQDISKPLTESGTWEVTYNHGIPVPRDGQYAAGYLAGELARACRNVKCALPRRVQSIARQGVSIQIVDNPDFLRDGLVGLTEVDQFIVSVNPHGLHSRSRVYSPDSLARSPRQSTWPTSM